MMRMLSWSAGLGGEKFPSADANIFASGEIPIVANVSSSDPAGLKRKRSPSLDDEATQQSVHVLARPLCKSPSVVPSSDTIHDQRAMQMKQESFDSQASLPSPPVTTTPDCHSPSSSPAPAAAMAVAAEAKLQKMRETISSQLSLEILLKHKELRLIDQEIAACQIALEQLRRCHEIPYPSMQAPSLAVTEGKGSAIRRSSERFPAESPPPWGVVDGPYSRHYSQWLLADPKFDGGEPSAVPQAAQTANISGRSTRGHVVDVFGGRPPKSRAQRAELKSLPAGYGQPKEKATGPMILKRKSDGVMVKLVCPDCGRLDFGSAQGFINHCRIGHTRSFASHDAAAEACGEPVQYNDNGTVKGVETAPAPPNPHIHPLVRSAKVLPPSPMPVRTFNLDVNAKPDLANQDEQNDGLATGFVASAQTPNLSALVKNKGFGLNLQDIVADAKSKTQPSQIEDDMEESEVESPAPTGNGRHPQTAGSKQPAKSSMSNDSSGLLNSRLPYSVSTGRPSVQPLSRTSLHEQDGRRESFMGLLPSPTNESTQAPSLVDDDEEFDPQTPISTHDADDMDGHELDFEVHDEEQHEQVSLRGSDLSGSQGTCTRHNPIQHDRQAMATRALGSEEIGKRTMFISSSPVPEDGERKRRKLE